MFLQEQILCASESVTALELGLLGSKSVRLGIGYEMALAIVVWVFV